MEMYFRAYLTDNRYNHITYMKRFFIAIAAAMLSGAFAFAQSVIPFTNGDRAVYLGDSITDGGHYHSYIWLYYMTRFPYMDLTVVNAGIGGNTASDMYERLDGDVFIHEPTVLMVTFGMNDTGYMEYNQEGAEKYGEKRYREACDNFDKIEKRLLALDNVHIVMVGGSPYDETAQIEGNVAFKGKNAVMDRIVAYQKAAAERNGWDFVDFSKPLVEVSAKMQAEDPSFTLTMGDRIHPDNDGHMVMAYLFLKAQGFAGRKVADIEVDAATSNVVKSENCAISDVQKDRKGISFSYLAESLPYPLDTVARGFGAHRGQAGALKMVPFMEEMNQETLKVTGLEGKYNLYIDDQLLGSWDGKNLAEGINMTELTWSPQYQQALQVMYLNEWRWEIERSFRDFAWMQFGFLKPLGCLDNNDRRAVEAIDRHKAENIWAGIHRDTYARLMHEEVRDTRIAEMNMLTDKIYQINKPVEHRISLRLSL